jgi:transcription initiation factor TFIIIB Brf1 subunit/transcription initiation factor TFIIB
LAGFGLDGVEQRIPCPHCGSTDCCGLEFEKGHEGDPAYGKTICIKTGKVVTVKMLEESAKKHGLMK